MGKNSEISKQLVVKFWFNWSKHGAVSYSLIFKELKIIWVMTKKKVVPLRLFWTLGYMTKIITISTYRVDKLIMMFWIQQFIFEISLFQSPHHVLISFSSKSTNSKTMISQNIQCVNWVHFKFVLFIGNLKIDKQMSVFQRYFTWKKCKQNMLEI